MFTFISYFCLFFFIISSFSDRISPLAFPYISYFGLFFPFVFCLNILFFLFCFALKKWKQMFVTLIIFLICWEAIYTYFPIHKKIKKIPEKCIHVLTYNIMHFGNSNEYLEVNHNPIIQYIVDQNPDIICLQEFKSKNQAQLSAIRNALRSTPYYFILPCGVALFSKYDILSAKKVPLESVSNGALIAELNINGEKVTILNCHLESNKISDSEKIEYFNLIKAPNIYKLKSFMYVMFSKLTPAFKMRAIQSIIISEIIKKNKNRYVIVCGDFNDTPISYTYHKIKGDLNDAFVENGCGMGISFDSNHFLFRIDYILHSNNMRSYNIMVGKLKDSDHYPVQTYLRFIHN